LALLPKGRSWIPPHVPGNQVNPFTGSDEDAFDDVPALEITKGFGFLHGEHGEVNLPASDPSPSGAALGSRSDPSPSGAALGSRSDPSPSGAALAARTCLRIKQPSF
jgi:hypothetical protein